MTRLFVAAFVLLSALPSFAQESFLPRGIGIYSFGYREYATQTEKFNSSGARESIAKPFQKDFTGKNLINGVGGPDLTKLLTELRKFDSFSDTQDSLVNTINLGTMDGQAEASLSATIFGMAYGVTNNISLFLAAPYIEASTDVEISFEGRNNAALIQERLGESAFEELKDGLRRAQSISAQVIKQSIEDNGYAPIDHWEYQGLGDMQVGSILGNRFHLTRRNEGISSLKTTIILPTGYVDDPDVLTDVPIGRGTYSLLNEVKQSLIYRRSLWFGVGGIYGYHLPTTLEKRVPEENESVVAAERKTLVDFAPGADTNVYGQLGFNFSIFKLMYMNGRKTHAADAYSGSIDGNYEKMAEGSALDMHYHLMNLKLQTADLYSRGKFPIPLILDFTYHEPIKAKNALDERYFEIGIASFFKNPAVARKKSKRNQRLLGRKKARPKAKKSRIGH